MCHKLPQAHLYAGLKLNSAFIFSLMPSSWFCCLTDKTLGASLSRLFEKVSSLQVLGPSLHFCPTGINLPVVLEVLTSFIPCCDGHSDSCLPRPCCVQGRHHPFGSRAAVPWPSGEAEEAPALPVAPQRHLGVLAEGEQSLE